MSCGRSVDCTSAIFRYFLTSTFLEDLLRLFAQVRDPALRRCSDSLRDMIASQHAKQGTSLTIETKILDGYIAPPLDVFDFKWTVVLICWTVPIVKLKLASFHWMKVWIKWNKMLKSVRIVEQITYVVRVGQVVRDSTFVKTFKGSNLRRQRSFESWRPSKVPSKLPLRHLRVPLQGPLKVSTTFKASL